MPIRLFIGLIIGLAFAVWVAALFARGVEITWEHAWPFTITVSVVSLIALTFERVLWKWPIFRGWLVRRPHVQGTWRVHLQSNWIDPHTGEQAVPIDCVMTIRQTFSTLSLRLYTEESSSFLLAGKLIEQDDGVFQIAGVYQNNPSVHLRGQRSEIHHGALLLEIMGDPPKSLRGHYWTDRATKGSLDLTERRTQLVSTYEDGARIYKLQQRN